MSTLKSSAEDLTLNADGSGNDIKFQSNAVEKASLSDAGLLTTSGGASLDGAVTINDTGADVDFRVEGSGEANALFVQGSDGAIGIGTGAPARPLHISKDSTWAQVRLERPTTSAGTVHIGAGDDEFKVADSAYALRLTVATDTGDTNIKTGDLIFGTAGKGICLGVTTNTDSNTLDDYEVGTWSPNIGGNATYSNQVGNYIKIGNLVWAHYAMTINTKGTGSVVGAIYGVPFASGYASQNSVAMHWNNLATGIVYGTYYLGAAGSTMNFSNLTASATSLNNNPDIWQDGAAMIGVHIYSIA